MSTIIKSISLTLVCSFCFLFAIISPTYAAALPGNGASLSVSSTAVGLTFAGTSGSRYHFYLSVQLPIGLNPSNLSFGTPTTARSITDYDFISYAGNSVTVDFFYMSDGNSYTYQLKSLDPSFDLTQSEVVSYGVVGVSLADIPGSTMFIYDKVLALRSWENVSHYMASIDNNMSVSTTPLAIPTYTYTANNHYDIISGNLSSVSIDSSPSTTYRPVGSVSLTGGLTSTTNFDMLHGEWGQFLDRVSAIGSLSLSLPVFSTFLPGDIYFPWSSGSSMTVTPSSGFLYTNGLSPTYMSFVLDISARPGSVSLSGVDLVTWSYSDGRLTIEAKKDNASGDSSIPLNSVSINLGNLSTNFPLLKIENFCVGSFEIPTMISNMDSSKQQNIVQRGFQNIQSTLNNLFSGLTEGYNSSTSEDLGNLESGSDEFNTTTEDYLQDEADIMNYQITDSDGNSSTLTAYLTDFDPDPNSFLELASAFAVVGTVSNEIYNISGQYRFLLTFILTFGLILFILQIRRG